MVGVSEPGMRSIRIEEGDQTVAEEVFGITIESGNAVTIDAL
ncbi:hypothetical protein [Alteromonas lipolytica]|nr:hypothetical protein [Alteromonas lipolytica]GGF79752.1 hypothetical protein GCM10011338_35100 [Alteromonas lipolytica]